MAASDHLAPQQFGAYTLHADRADRIITATHPDTEHLGSIGHLSWVRTVEGDSTGRSSARVGDVYVSPGHRGNGLATAMYHMATRATGRPLAHSAYRTDAGEGWARSVGGAMPPRKEAGRE